MPINSDELAELNESLIDLRDFIKPGRDELEFAQLAEATLDGPAAPLLHSGWHKVMDDSFRYRWKPPLNTSHFRCDSLGDEQIDALHDLVRSLAQVVVITDILKYEPAAKKKLDGQIIDFIEAKRTKLISDMPKQFSVYFDIALESHKHKPVWDGWTLKYRGRIVKQFRKRAANQMLVLETFQDSGWPQEIDNPLKKTANVNPNKLVNQTAKDLNDRRESKAIEFAPNLNGTGFVCRIVQN